MRRLAVIVVVGLAGAGCGAGTKGAGPRHPSSSASAVSPGIGTYRSKVTAQEAKAAGKHASDVAGRYTLVLNGETFQLTQVSPTGEVTHLQGTYDTTAGRVVLTFTEGLGTDTLGFTTTGKAIRFHVVSFTGNSTLALERAVWDSEPWVRAGG